MSPLHRSWLADQADAIKYQREMRELDTYANPYRRAALEDEHGDNKHAQEYAAALELIACHARLWAPEAKAVQPDGEAA